MALDPAEREELIRGALAQEELDEAWRGHYADVYLAATGKVTTEKIMRNITVLMSALADPSCWLLAPDPIAWRDTMLDLFADQFSDFVVLVERAMGEPL